MQVAMGNTQSVTHEARATAPILNSKKAEKQYAELKKKAGQFRVLILGRANAGKTTILQKICNTTDDPEVYNRDGRKVTKLYACDRGRAYF